MTSYADAGLWAKCNASQKIIEVSVTHDLFTHEPDADRHRDEPQRRPISLAHNGSVNSSGCHLAALDKYHVNTLSVRGSRLAVNPATSLAPLTTNYTPNSACIDCTVCYPSSMSFMYPLRYLNETDASMNFFQWTFALMATCKNFWISMPHSRITSLLTRTVLLR